MTDRRPTEIELDRLWNDLSRGGSPEGAYGLSRDDADAVRLFHVLATTPPSDAARERVGRMVLAEIDRFAKEHEMTSAVTWDVLSPWVDRAKTRPELGRTRTRPAGGWARGRRWVAAQLATAMLLLITAVGIYWSSRDGGPSGSGPNVVVIPALQQGCGADATAGPASPVAVGIRAASPTAAGDAVTFVWASEGVPEAPEVVSHVAIDPQCRLWVMDQGADRFLIFDLDGNLLETWGEAGSGEGQIDFGSSDFAHYNGIAFAHDGGFYVSDAGNRRVQRFDAERQFVRAWITSGADAEPETPGWVAVGPDGNAYVTVGTVEDIVQVYSPDGAFVRAFGSNAAGPGHLLRYGPIAFDPAGNLWVMDPLANDLVQFSSAGEPLGRLELAEIGTFSIGLAIDAEGRFYVADYDDNMVSVYASDGTFLYSWGRLGLKDGQFLNPIGIVLDGAGGVYVTDGGPRIQKFQLHP